MEKEIAEHNCLEYIEWESELRIDGDGEPYYKGECIICGKTFHKVYSRVGIYDLEAKKYAMRFK